MIYLSYYSITRKINFLIFILSALTYISCQDDLNNELTTFKDSINYITIDEVKLPYINKSHSSFLKENGDQFDLFNKNYFSAFDDKKTKEVLTELNTTKNRNSETDYLISINKLFNNSSNRKILTHNDLSYESVVYCLNKERADFNKKPVVALGGGFKLSSEHDNYLPAYIIDDVGNKTEFFIGEKETNKLENPVLVISSHTKDSVKADNDKIVYDSIGDHLQEKNRSINNSSYNYSFNIGSYKIKHRYENSGKSEYNISQMHYYSSDQFQFANDHKGFNLNDIHRRDIDKELFYVKPFPFMPKFYYRNLTYLGTYIVTFECDWYASKKFIAVDGPGGTKYHQLRMKNSDNFYQRIYIPVQYNYIYFHVSNEKGFFRGQIIATPN
ncbi:hypothetical protein QYS49_13350 [Marivirga salinae]|uniref:Uncharacterized protein n=1 Tax=Marivirga salinarum TaxID=3059078 RepID=A0AA49GCK1_9BACT|nr:hypothetical protein [Marivirga sp. BDSF4-3]WKK77958.2 hypothetical protein QYS49_13350 [Marivirga sp. BDSF4-3]